MNWRLRRAVWAVFQHGAAELLNAGGGGGGTPPIIAPTNVQVTPAPGGGGAQPPANDYSWLGAEAPEELRGYVTTKGFKDARTLAESYQNLEKSLGAHRLALPKDEKDDAGWGKVYDAMGRPKTAAEYKLPVPQGADPKFAAAAAEVLHKAGLNTKQATAIATWWNEAQGNAVKLEAEARAGESQKQETELRAHWGGAWDQNLATAKRAAALFGIDPAAMDKLDGALGTRGTLELLHRIGGAISEHGGGAGLEGSNGGAPQGSGMTPEQAKAEITQKRGDAAWAKKLLDGEAEAKARWDLLHKWAYPS
jgi:hypothetical protein